MTITFVNKNWTDQIITKLRRSVTYIDATKSIDNIYGDPYRTDAVGASKNVVFVKTIDRWYFDRDGLIEGGDAYAIVGTDQSITPVKDDKFTVDSETYRIQDVLKVYSDDNNSTLLYYFCNCFKLS